jgi:hypothetical protein
MLLDGHRRLCEQPIDLSRLQRPGVALVRAELVVHERRSVRQRGPGVDDRRERLVFDLDKLGRVRCSASARRRDHGDGVTGIARLVDRYGQVPRCMRVLGREPGARQRALPLVRQVGARPRGHDIGVRERGPDVHRLDPRVRVRAAHDAEEDHSGQTHVVDPLRLALQKLRVLFSLDGRADEVADCDVRRSAHRATASIASTMFW